MATFVIATSWSHDPISRQFRGVASTLAERGHRCVVIVDGQRRDVEDHARNPAIYTWPSRRPVHVADARFLWALLREHRPECIVGNFGSGNLTMLVGLAARVPVRVIWYHTMAEASRGDLARSRWHYELLRARKALVYRAASHLVANSDAARADAIRSFRVNPTRASTFHNSIPDPRSGIPPLPRADDLIACVGRLTRLKGQHVVLEALSRVQIPVRVSFVGDGPARAELETLAARLGVRATFHGALPRPEALRIVAGAAVAVVPTLSEAFGLVNLEAMALGTPLVASATGGVPEIVRDGIDGVTVAPGDSAALAGALDRLFSAPTERARLGSNGRARFEATFDQRTAIPRLGDWLEGAVRQARMQNTR